MSAAAADPGDWGTPPPGRADEEAVRFIRELHASNSLDEGTPAVLDRLVNPWIDQWRAWARAAKERDVLAPARAALSEASGHRDFAERLLRTSYQQLSLARRDVVAAGLPAPAEVSYGSLLEGSDEVLAAGEDGPGEKRSRMPSPRRGAVWGQRLRRLLPWLVIGVMAGADAYGFWVVLVGRIQRDSVQTMLFVVAISIASVAAAHEIGRAARRRADGEAPRSRPWIAALAFAWGGLGVTMFWLRAHPVTVAAANDGRPSDGVFGQGGTSPAATAVTQDQWGVAALLGLVYLMTGAVAMAHAYRATQQPEDEVRDAIENWTKAQTELANRLYHYRRAAQNLKDSSESLLRLQQDTSADEECLAAGEAVKRRARIEQARLLGTPPGTQAVTEDDHEPYVPGPVPPERPSWSGRAPEPPPTVWPASPPSAPVPPDLFSVPPAAGPQPVPPGRDAEPPRQTPPAATPSPPAATPSPPEAEPRPARHAAQPPPEEPAATSRRPEPERTPATTPEPGAEPPVEPRPADRDPRGTTAPPRRPLQHEERAAGRPATAEPSDGRGARDRGTGDRVDPNASEPIDLRDRIDDPTDRT